MLRLRVDPLLENMECTGSKLFIPRIEKCTNCLILIVFHERVELVSELGRHQILISIRTVKWLQSMDHRVEQVEHLVHYLDE